MAQQSYNIVTILRQSSYKKIAVLMFINYHVWYRNFSEWLIWIPDEMK